MSTNFKTENTCWTPMKRQFQKCHQMFWSISFSGLFIWKIDVLYSKFPLKSLFLSLDVVQFLWYFGFVLEISHSFHSILQNFRSINFRVDSILKHSASKCRASVIEFQLLVLNYQNIFMKGDKGMLNSEHCASKSSQS